MKTAVIDSYSAAVSIYLLDLLEGYAVRLHEGLKLSLIAKNRTWGQRQHFCTVSLYAFKVALPNWRDFPHGHTHGSLKIRRVSESIISCNQPEKPPELTLLPKKHRRQA